MRGAAVKGPYRRCVPAHAAPARAAEVDRRVPSASVSHAEVCTAASAAPVSASATSAAFAVA